MRNSFLSVLLMLSFALLSAHAQSDPASTMQPAEFSADLGTCSALFTVTSAAGPVQNAKITTRIHYGTFGVKKLDLETYTNINGQVKIVRLPEVPKKPIYFYITKDDKEEIVEFKPEEHCRATFDVRLK